MKYTKGDIIQFIEDNGDIIQDGGQVPKFEASSRETDDKGKRFLKHGDVRFKKTIGNRGVIRGASKKANWYWVEFKTPSGSTCIMFKDENLQLLEQKQLSYEIY